MWNRLVQVLRLMVGVGDYPRYLEHRRAHHPGEPVLSEAEFVARSQQARYAGSSSRCC